MEQTSKRKDEVRMTCQRREGTKEVYEVWYVDRAVKKPEAAEGARAVISNLCPSRRQETRRFASLARCYFSWVAMSSHKMKTRFICCGSSS